MEPKGITVRQWQFCKLNLPLVVVSMVASSAVLVREMYVVHKDLGFAFVFVIYKRSWIEI